MRHLKKVIQLLVGFGLGLLIGLLLLFLAAYWQRDALFRWLKEELQQRFHAQIRLSHYHVKIWPSFPNIRLQLENLQMNTFEGRRLFSAKEVGLDFDIYAFVVHQRYILKKLMLVEPHLHLQWDAKGRFNWSTVIGEGREGASASWQISALQIRDGSLQYLDEKARIRLALSAIHLQAALQYALAPDTLWEIRGQGTATVDSFQAAQGWRLPKGHLQLKTNLVRDALGLHLIPLEVGIGGLVVGLKGRIEWTSPLKLDLQVRNMRLDFAGLSSWVPGFPKAWQEWPGRLSATGYVKGLLGAGAFPTLYLKAYAKQLSPFPIRGHTLYKLAGRLELLWNPKEPTRSQLVVDSFSLQAENGQWFQGKGQYQLSQQRWHSVGKGQLDLTTLTLFGLDSLAGQAKGQLTLEYASKASWGLHFEGQGSQIEIPPLAGHRFSGSLKISYQGRLQVAFEGQLDSFSYPPAFVGHWEGVLHFSTEKASWKEGGGQIALEGQLDSLSYPPAFVGHWEGVLRFSSAKTPWKLEGQGRLRRFIYPPFTIQEALLSATPTHLDLRQARLRYDTLSAMASRLRLSPPAALWDSTLTDLAIEGDLTLTQLPFPLPHAMEGSSKRQLSFYLDLSVQTLLWAQRRYGPLQASLRQNADSLTIYLHALRGLAGGQLQGKAHYSRSTWHLDLSAQAVDLAQIHKDFPPLDTVLPILRHLEGVGHVDLKATIPLLQNKIRWVQAQAAADLHLSHLIVRESPYTYALFQMIPLTDFREIRVGEVQAHLTLQNGVISLDTTNLSANRWRMQVVGHHTLYGDIHYDILAEVPRPILDKSTQRVSTLVEEVEGEQVLVALHMRGTVDKPVVRWAPKNPSPPKKTHPIEGSSPAPPPKKHKKDLPIDEN